MLQLRDLFTRVMLVFFTTLQVKEYLLQVLLLNYLAHTAVQGPQWSEQRMSRMEQTQVREDDCQEQVDAGEKDLPLGLLWDFKIDLHVLE